jgi:hypothetical protein
MSNRRSRGGVSEEEINELISRLQTLLPSARRRGGSQVRVRALHSEHKRKRTTLAHKPTYIFAYVASIEVTKLSVM